MSAFSGLPLTEPVAEASYPCERAPTGGLRMSHTFLRRRLRPRLRRAVGNPEGDLLLAGRLAASPPSLGTAITSAPRTATWRL